MAIPGGNPASDVSYVHVAFAPAILAPVNNDRTGFVGTPQSAENTALPSCASCVTKGQARRADDLESDQLRLGSGTSASASIRIGGCRATRVRRHYWLDRFDVIEEACEGVPASEHVVHRPGDLAVA
jgi:hypothetical protein